MRPEEGGIDVTPRTLRPRLRRKLGLIALTIPFVAVGAWALLHGAWVIGWVATTFFGLCLIVFIIQLLPGSTSLTLDAEGFEVYALFRRSRYSWSDIAQIDARRVGSTPGGASCLLSFGDPATLHSAP